MGRRPGELFDFASGQKGPTPPLPLLCFEKQVSSPGELPQAPFFLRENCFFVLIRCRRRLLFIEKTRFWFQEGRMEFLDTCNQVPGGDGQSFSAHLAPPPH